MGTRHLMMSKPTAYYRRMWSVEEHLGGNAMSTASSRYHLRDLWRSPRGTVLRIEALAMVAIIFSFFLALFGSCRRWSKRWIVQKGFLAAQVLSLSLGTYSIGLMQSSLVKSEMYPIWAVSLLTLFGCIDPISTNTGLDYKGPLLKMIFQLCLYFGYVMLMSVSTISSDVGKLAIVLLSTITLIKGFHRALAFVQLQPWQDGTPEHSVGHPKRLNMKLCETIEDMPYVRDDTTANSMMIEYAVRGYFFSLQLRQRFLGLENPREMVKKLMALESLVRDNNTTIDYKQVLKVVEVELAFLFEAFFTSSEFLYFDQAKGGTLWALASLVGICFVGVVAAINPGAMASRINSAATGTGGAGAATSVVVVGTTTADLIITLVILVSLALLQVVQLIRCWTSIWARVRIALDTRGSRNKISLLKRLRMFLVARVNWFDKYLWQAMLGQDTLPALSERKTTKGRREYMLFKCRFLCTLCPCDCARSLGVFHFLTLVRVLLFSDITSPGGDVKLHKDVKASIAEFLGTIKSSRIGVEWSALFVKNGLQDGMEYLPYTNRSSYESEAYAFTRRVMIWHIVAMHLSKYCVYLVVSAPELLHGPPAQTEEALEKSMSEIRKYNRYHRADGGNAWLEKMQQVSFPSPGEDATDFVKGVHLGKRLRNEVMTRRPCSSDHWELLARLWVQTLLYAAPYGDVQVHLQRLAQGGEFITHLWALLFHLGIDEWEVAGIEELKAAAAAAEETTEVQEVAVQDDAGSGIEEIN